MADLLAGRYTIERELGQGGMARVFLAQDLRHRRPVAVKVLRPELAATLGRERFLREIATAAHLAHPHILPLLDSGDADGSLFYVMPYVEGESLRVRLNRERQLPLEEALRIVCDVAGALDYAHRHNVVHRDVKPENILFQDGQALVADFGIARALTAAQDDRLTQTGFALGTPTYMSPEQAATDAPVDGRSDVYSLGCVLYEMLAGEPPYTGPTAQAIVAKRLAEPVPRLRTLRDVPAAIEHAVTRALAKVPADRFASAAEFAAALTLQPGVPAAPGVPAERSIAVLPFANLSPDPEDEYLSDGITEEISTALARLGNVRVAARTSSFAFKGRHEDLRVIAERLGVSTLLEGSVRRAGRRLRIAVQLVNAADGYQLWSERYDREMDDVFAVQDDIARAIVDRLRITLAQSRAALVRPGTSDVRAYDLYLRGRYFWTRRGEGLPRAIEYFQRAIAADPDFAAAHAGLADAYCILGLYGYRPATALHGLTRDAAERALVLDASLSEAHYSVGLYEWNFGWNLDRAERELRRSIELSPQWGLPPVWLAMLTAALGRRREALELARRAERLDPLSPLIAALTGLAFSLAGASEEALHAAERAVELEPTFPGSYWSLGWVRSARGDLEGAIVALQQAATHSARSPFLVSWLGWTCGQGGRADAARRLLAELEARNADPAYRGLICWSLGEERRAFTLFEQGFAQRNAAVWMLGEVRPPAFASRRLGDDPRWTALLEKHGLGALRARPDDAGRR